MSSAKAKGLDELTNPLRLVHKSTFPWLGFGDVIEQLRVLCRYPGKVFCATASDSTLLLLSGERAVDRNKTNLSS